MTRVLEQKSKNLIIKLHLVNPSNDFLEITQERNISPIKILRVSKHMKS